jgi:hypothetical protein
MLRWLFEHDAVLDREGIVHRASCPLAPTGPDATPLAAGIEYERRRAPEECEKCRPCVSMRLGRPDRSPIGLD